ncbi:MAG: aminotransferase class I/II-fold pyridoxal phosphate-dependent enzyme [Candidatus Gracilibacteria bacterium]
MQINPSKKLASLKLYAFKEINDRVQQLKDKGIKPIDFGVGDPTDPTPDFVINALEQAGKKHAKTGYPSYIGSDEFRKAAANYMKRNFGIDLNPVTEISSNIGSKEAIFNFPQAFINPGDIVLIPSPGYPPMKTGTIFAEGVPYFVPLLEKNNWLLAYASIPEEIAQKAKILWINYPNSPTGAVADENYYKGLIDWAHKHNIIIAADEGCYIDIYFGKKPISILNVAKEGIITFYSLSKRNNMTGYRVGFVAGDEKIIDIFKSLKTNVDSGTPSVMQEAAIVALNNDNHVAEMRKLYQQKADILIEALSSIGLKTHKPEATFYIWQKVPDGMSDIEFATKLLDPTIGIVVTPGSIISDACGKINPGSGYVRFALVPNLEEVKEAAAKIKSAF